MGKFLEEMKAREAEKAKRAAAEASRRAESLKAFESSGAARKPKAAAPKVETATSMKARSGSLRGGDKSALEGELGIVPPKAFNRAVEGESWGTKRKAR
jgi:hypothetical protein